MCFDRHEVTRIIGRREGISRERGREEEKERETARFVFPERIREWARRHRKSTGEPNDFSHKPKRRPCAREATCSDSGEPSLGKAPSCSSWQKGSHDIRYARSAAAILGREVRRGERDSSLSLSLLHSPSLCTRLDTSASPRRTGFLAAPTDRQIFLLRADCAIVCFYPNNRVPRGVDVREAPRVGRDSLVKERP